MSRVIGSRKRRWSNGGEGRKPGRIRKMSIIIHGDGIISIQGMKVKIRSLFLGPSGNKRISGSEFSGWRKRPFGARQRRQKDFSMALPVGSKTATNIPLLINKGGLSRLAINPWLMGHYSTAKREPLLPRQRPGGGSIS